MRVSTGRLFAKMRMPGDYIREIANNFGIKFKKKLWRLPVLETENSPWKGSGNSISELILALSLRRRSELFILPLSSN